MHPLCYNLGTLHYCWLEEKVTMVTRLVDKREVQLPAVVLREFEDVEFFEISSDGMRIVLTPVSANRADLVRQKLDLLGLTERDIEAAVEWARNS